MNESLDVPEASMPQDNASYYLIAGQVAFEVTEQSGIQVLAINSLLKLPTHYKLDAKAIGMAQQGLQGMVHNRVRTLNPNARIKVVDVIILSIMFLGTFLPGEFEAGSLLADTPSAGQPN